MNEKGNKIKKVRHFVCIDLLNTFSEKEIEGLKDLIACRYFNTDRYVVRLLEALKKKVLNKGSFTDEMQCNVYRMVFDDLSVDKNRLDKKQKGLLNNKLNVLLRLAERFLSIETMDENDIHKCELLYPKLLERQQYVLFNRHINRDKKLLDEQSVKGIEQYKQAHRIEENILNYYHRTGSIIKKNNLPDLIHNIDINFLLNKLDIQITALTLKMASQEECQNSSSIKELTALMNLPQYVEHPLLVLYRTSIRLIELNDDKSYAFLLDLLEQYSKTTFSDVLRTFYAVAVNYCVSKMWTDKLAYTQKMFDLFNIMHHKNLLIDGGFIPVGRRFIQVGKVNTVYDINTRVLILKCLYGKEKTYNEYTVTAFRSIEKFFKTNKELPTENKKGYINFIRILINLYRIRYNEGKRTLEWLKEKLGQQQVISDKPWLLEKITELEADRN